jgi:hypothetical protein
LQSLVQLNTYSPFLYIIRTKELTQGNNFRLKEEL